MSYIYVNTEKDKDLLISKGLKVIQEYNQNKKTWVFEHNPSLFSLSENENLYKKFCLMDKLIMLF